MIKPTKHYQKLQKALNVYRLDDNYSTVEECVAHVLLDVKVWAENCGMIGSERLILALRRCNAIIMEQYEQAIRELEEMEDA